MVRPFFPIFVGAAVLGGSAITGYSIVARSQSRSARRLPPPQRRTPLFIAGGAGNSTVAEQIEDLAFFSGSKSSSARENRIRCGDGSVSFLRRVMFQVFVCYRGLLLLIRSIPVAWYFVLSRLHLADAHFFHVSLREMLISMGPTYMKLGQWMATRPDIFPDDMCHVLSKLFDRTPPHSWEHTEQRLRSSGVLQRLSSIEKEPLNSGSVAQVHRGVLRDAADGIDAGTEVVVKVLHPKIELRIAADLSAMRYAILVMRLLIPGFEYTDPDVSINEFSGLIVSQLDLVRECDNLLQFRYNFQDMPRIAFPTPAPSITTHDVLVETFEAGQCIQTGNALSVNDMELAELGCNMFHKMLFHDNFVHSDLHPGNVLVRDYVPAADAVRGTLSPPSDNQRKQIVVLDTGLVTSLSPKERENFLALFGAVAAGDGELGARLMIERSKHNKCTDELRFVEDMKSVFEQVNPDKTVGFTLAHVAIGDILTKVMKTLRRHQVYIDGNFASLVLTVIVGEGMGRKLHPEFNIFQASAPYLVQYLEGTELQQLAAKLRQKYGVQELLRAFGGA